MPRVLSIAGTDPSGGAGIQADLKSIAANGGYGMAVVTALVAQNTRGVRSVHVPPVEFLAEQLDAVSDDVGIDAVKIGMLANAPVIAAVSDWLDRVRPPIVVLDPVMIATSGDRLLDADAEAALRALVPRADVVTPNIAELAILAGERAAADWPETLAQAARVATRYRVRVLAKGGHLDGGHVSDALVEPSGPDGIPTVTEFPGERIRTRNTHGTGCSLSSALATRVAAGGDWALAAAESKRWLAESIRHGSRLDVGSGNGPVSHFAGLWARGGLATAPTPAEVEADWWAEIAGVRAEIDDLPFVRGLADGTLGREAFLEYLAQDALYLRDYARALAEAARLAPTPVGPGRRTPRSPRSRACTRAGCPNGRCTPSARVARPPPTSTTTWPRARGATTAFSPPPCCRASGSTTTSASGCIRCRTRCIRTRRGSTPTPIRRSPRPPGKPSTSSRALRRERTRRPGGRCSTRSAGRPCTNGSSSPRRGWRPPSGADRRAPPGLRSPGGATADARGPQHGLHAGREHGAVAAGGPAHAGGVAVLDQAQRLARRTGGEGCLVQ